MPTSTKCSVPKCKSNRKDSRITFISLLSVVKDKERAEKWIQILKLPKDCLSTPQKYLVCEKHFSKTQFANKNRIRLKKNAIPKPFLSSEVSEAHSQLTYNKVDVALKTPVILPSIPSLILPALLTGNNVQGMPPQIPNIRNFPSTRSKNYKPFNFCIVCQAPSKENESEDSESEEPYLKSFLCRILNLKSTSFCGFPICKTCQERVKELETVYVKLKMLSLDFEKQREGLKRDIVNTYLKCHNKIFKLDLTEAIVKKWSSSGISEKTSQLFQQQQPSAHNNSQTIVLPVGFSFDGNQIPAERNTSTPPVLRILRPLKKKGITESDFDVSNGIENFMDEYGEEKRNSVGSLGKCDITEEYYNIKVESDITEEFNITEECAITEEFIIKEEDDITEECNITEQYNIKEECDITEGFTYRSVDSSFPEEKISSFNNKPNRKVSHNKLLKKYYEKSKKKCKKSKNYHKKITCPICLNTYMGTLKIHLSTHTGYAEKLHQCVRCKKRFHRTSHLTRHIRQVHRESNNEIQVIDKSRLYFCGLCESTCNFKPTIFLRHLKSFHLNKEIVDGETLWFHHCDSDDCKRSFRHQDQLKHHIIEDHLNNDSSLLHTCGFCQRLFCGKENLLTHGMCHNSNPTSIPCNYCYMGFDSVSELEDHTSKHKIVFQLSDFSYKCEFCDEVFRNSVARWNHHRYCSNNQNRKQIRLSKQRSVKCSIDSDKEDFHQESSISCRSDQNGGNNKQTRITKRPKVIQAIKRLTCSVCSFSCKRNAMANHMRIHTGEKPYQCKECGKYFRQIGHLQTHTKNVHEKAANFRDDGTKIKFKARTYTCGFCSTNKQYVECLLQRHFKSVHLIREDIRDGESILYTHCDSSECHRSFANQSQLKDHLLEVHLSNDMSLLNQCKFCDRIFCMKENYLTHSTCHTSKQPTFPCNCCYMVFNTEMELTNHLPSHQIVFQLENFRYMCEHCGKIFIRKTSLTLHNKYATCTSKKSFKKSISKRNSVSKQTKASDRIKRVSFRKRIPVCRGDEQVKCTICDHVFKSHDILKFHLLKVHSITGTLKTNNFCEECQRFFIDNKDLKGHMFRYHPEQSLRGKKYCIVCYELFDTEEAIDTHFQDQHPDNICPVESCGRKCPSKSSLERHKRVHNGEKPFSCSFCETRFSDSSTLQFHINTRHTFHRSYLCTMCPENPGFYDRRTFYKHVSLNHAEKNPGDILKTNYLKRKFCIDNPRIPPENKVKPHYVQNSLSSVENDV